MSPPSTSPRAPHRPARVVFFGSGTFAVPILAALVGAPDAQVVAVVTVPDRPAGRGERAGATPIAGWAREHGLGLLRPPDLRSHETLDAIAALEPDLGVLADYGRLVPATLLEVPAGGFLNVHPSLLPRHRGATPVPATILAGDSVAGVTLIRMDAGLDTGPIVAADAWPLTGSETAPELEARAAAAGGALLRRSLAGWLEGALAATPQPAQGVTLTRPFRREEGRLDPTRPADELERRVRALQPWPGSFLETSAGRLVVWRGAVASGVEPGLGPAGPGLDAPGAPDAVTHAPDGAQPVAPATQPPAPGRLVPHGRGLALVTAAGRLVLLEVQLAGRRRIGGEEFVHGHPGLVGEAVR